MKATEDNVSVKKIGLIVEVNLLFYAWETLRMCSLSRGLYLLNSKTWPFLHINAFIWWRHVSIVYMKGILFSGVEGVFRTVHTVVRIEEFYARCVHKTLLKMTVVCYYCRSYFIFIRILRVPSRDPGFSLFRGRDSGFLREGGARLVKWNRTGHGIRRLFTCNAGFEKPYLEPRTGNKTEPFFFYSPRKKLVTVWLNRHYPRSCRAGMMIVIQLSARFTVVSPTSCSSTSWVVSHTC